MEMFHHVEDAQMLPDLMLRDATRALVRLGADAAGDPRTGVRSPLEGGASAPPGAAEATPSTLSGSRASSASAVLVRCLPMNRACDGDAFAGGATIVLHLRT